MAYQNVGTPRFYIDLFQHLKSLGLQIIANDDKYLDLLNLDPTSTTECHNVNIRWGSEFDENGQVINSDDTLTLEMSRLIIPEQAYYALLNHDCVYDGGDNFEASCYINNPADLSKTFDSKVEVLNANSIESIPLLSCQKGSTIMTGDISGWTITDENATFSPYNTANIETYIGCL